MAKENKIETEINEIKGEPNKHLTERQRMEIQDCLAHGVRFKDIGKRIGKNQTTVSREVKQHLSVQPARSKDSDSLKPCPLLLKAPFVCNGCDRRSRCRLERHFYYARVAHQEYPVVLTDNGGEFANAASVEMSLDGQQESHLFFCDPYASYQKPHVVKGHTLLRDILPSGSSFDGLSQEQVDLVFSHINGVLRSDLGGKSSFDVFSFMYSAAIANCLGIQQIYPSAVLQSPVLLK